MKTYRIIQHGAPQTWLPVLVSLLFIVLLVLTTSVTAAQPTRISVGVYDNKPIVFEASPGLYAGLSVDVLEAIARQENWSINYVHGPWEQVLGMLETGNIDLLVGK